MGNLLLSIKDIADKDLTAYKEDINYDVEILRNGFIENKKQPISYIWFTRRSGTAIMKEKFIKVKNSNENVSFNYWKGSTIHCFRIIIEKITPKNIFGSIEKINLNKYEKDVELHTEEYEKALIKIETVDGKVIENEYDFKENYFYDVLNKEKLPTEKVKHFKILNFIK